MPEFNEKQIKEIKEIAEEFAKKYKPLAFTERKVTDTPTDSLSVVNRKFVTNNGALTARPVSSVATVGQFYLDTSSNTPIWYTAAGWRNSVGSIVAQNN